MSDGNSMAPVPEPNAGSRHVMEPVGAIDGFGPIVTTSDVKAGMGNVAMVSLQGSDGSGIYAEHHQVGVMSVPAPTQDVPPGESAAKP